MSTEKQPNKRASREAQVAAASAMQLHEEELLGSSASNGARKRQDRELCNQALVTPNDIMKEIFGKKKTS